MWQQALDSGHGVFYLSFVSWVVSLTYSPSRSSMTRRTASAYELGAQKIIGPGTTRVVLFSSCFTQTWAMGIPHWTDQYIYILFFGMPCCFFFLTRPGDIFLFVFSFPRFVSTTLSRKSSLLDAIHSAFYTLCHFSACLSLSLPLCLVWDYYDGVIAGFSVALLLLVVGVTTQSSRVATVTTIST